MNVMQSEGTGGLDGLRLAERPVPEPGTGEVLVKMRAASLNYRDLLSVTDPGSRGFHLPLVPLSDGCGEVVAVGPGVTRVQRGDRVATLFFQRWLSGRATREGRASILGGPLDGCLSEYICLNADGVSHVPAHLSDLEVATLPCAALTAWNALAARGGLKAGETVVAQGTGGVSVFALQFAKLFGAEVIVTSSSDEKLERARVLGADHTINYRRHPQWSEQVLAVTGGQGADHILDVGGPTTLAESIRAVRLDGQISVIGSLSAEGENPPIAGIIRSGARLQGIYVGSREQFEDMGRAIAAHKLQPVVDRVFPFADARAALEYLQGQHHVGKICIQITT